MRENNKVVDLFAGSHRRGSKVILENALSEKGTGITETAVKPRTQEKPRKAQSRSGEGLWARGQLIDTEGLEEP